MKKNKYGLKYKVSAKPTSQVYKTRRPPPVPPKEDLLYDEPDNSYDSNVAIIKPQPSKIKPKRSSLPPLPLAPIETSPTADRESLILMDLKKPKVFDSKLF